MKAVLLSALLVLPSLARAADDAPTVLHAGDAAPVSGVLLPDALAVRDGKELASCRAELPALRKSVADAPSVPVVVALVVAGVVLGGAAGAGVAYAVKR